MELGGHFQKEVMLALSTEKLIIAEMMTKDFRLDMFLCTREDILFSGRVG